MKKEIYVCNRKLPDGRGALEFNLWINNLLVGGWMGHYNERTIYDQTERKVQLLKRDGYKINSVGVIKSELPPKIRQKLSQLEKGEKYVPSYSTYDDYPASGMVSLPDLGILKGAFKKRKGKS